MFKLSELKIIHDALLTLLLWDSDIGVDDGKSDEIEKVLSKSTEYIEGMRGK